MLNNSSAINLPLHGAAQCSTSVATVGRLIERHPDALQTRDKFGRLPLHLAAKGSKSAGVVAALIAAWPEALEQHEDDGEDAMT